MLLGAEGVRPPRPRRRGRERSPRSAWRGHRRGRGCLVWSEASSSPQKLLAGWHGVDDELEPFSNGRADLEESAGGIGSDQHGEFAELEYSDGVSVGMQHV